MSIQPNKRDVDGSSKIQTGDLPVKLTNVALYKKANGDYVIQKFGKEFPELYVGLDYVLKALKNLRATSVSIREGGTGIVPTILSLALPRVKVTVSVWSADTALVNRNLEENLDYHIEVTVEEKVQHQSEVCVLVHESYQNQESMFEEIVSLIDHSSKGILFMISHKSKGAETLAQNVATSTGLQYEIVARGKGGARVIKFSGKPTNIAIASSTKSYWFMASGSVITIQTGNDSFSKDMLDIGSAMLIDYISHFCTGLAPTNIWDLGCGAGPIGIASALLFPRAKVVMSDANARVISIAGINAKNAGVGSRTQVILSDGGTKVGGKFDLILSNPPLHIPRQHLVKILTQARRKLVKGGKMFLVVEDSQVPILSEAFQPIIGTPKVAKKGATHFILEINK